MEISRLTGAPGRRGAAPAAFVLALGLAAGAAASTAVTRGGWVVVLAALAAAGGGLLTAAAVLVAATTGRSAAEQRAVAAEERARAAELRSAAADRRAERAEQATRDTDAELTGLASAAVDHLQAPLVAVAGLAELLREEAGLDPAARGFAERIGHSTDRMLRTVAQLRAYTSVTDAALRPEPVDTERLALDVVATVLDRHTGPAPRVDVAELPVVTADAALLRQVLEHLVDNALRYVRHGTAAQLRIGAAETGSGWWRIEVADRGIGVPQEHRTRIFAPFHRTPAADGYPGSGLGLAVCRRIVAMHGGEIGVTANPGGGSVFGFTVSAAGLTVPDLLAELTAG